MAERKFTEKDLQLFRLAKKAAENAYAPFSDYKVGAALLGTDEQVYTGCNVENSSYGGTICAERTAAVKAVSEGCKTFEALAVTSLSGEASPCGICRQFLYEFAPDLRIITGAGEENLNVTTLRELLPGGFRLEAEGAKE
ncbi:MAG: cytidine deaminase [Firmicutes bacterium]|nr:cytidine deaminase [Bacillota bacterium]